MQNYLELFEALMAAGVPTEPRPRNKRHGDDLYYCEKNGKVGVLFNPEECKRSVNKCWDAACQWPLRSCERTHRRALRLLVDELLPLLARPQLTTDLLWDSLDCGGVLSVLALRGVAELVTRHGVEYPSIYDRLYGLLEPAALAKASSRLLHTTGTFLSSTHIPGSLVAAFAKRLSRLALLAAPADCLAMLGLVVTLVAAHPELRRMLREREGANIIPKDPYIMEETCATASQAIKSSLWEISALRRHFAPEVSAAASRILAEERASATPATPTPDQTDFDRDLKMWFKNIEMNFVRPSAFENASPLERVAGLWEMDV
ncbi:hypothetical protein MSG28_000069 [Choristoneura fumiferana]|uniref:Uncharacterized protein n=2 Tax=Choristoneura fumiferana TaxID=7141 RepID=A0ACC0JZP2_CHOFU|nr:hypothetical protein MSG28_000069 [Choristoneura fumiferana]